MNQRAWATNNGYCMTHYLLSRILKWRQYEEHVFHDEFPL